MTPPEVFRIPGADGGWRVRVTPNKFAALVPDAVGETRQEGLKRTIPGLGVHEVIVENPAHNMTIPFLPDDHVRDILMTYRGRYREIEDSTQLEQVVIFKNHGAAAGTSLEHPHSQLVATPLVPPNIRHRIEEAVRYYDQHRECVYCRMLKEELSDGARIVMETQHHVAFVPFAALSPFHIWVFPRRHNAAFRDIADNEVADLAQMLKGLLGKLYVGLEDPDFNYTIRSAPGESKKVKYLHWYLTVVPRVTKMAGFEIGSGMFINTALPEQSAAFLRAQKPPMA
jgi:UDPglucose--hexose-1-phosphate uridylyltransferase